MKKYIISALIFFTASNVFATAFCSKTINVHKNFTITVDYQYVSLSIEEQDEYRIIISSGYILELYFDLLTWVKNVENELLNTNGKIVINLADVQARSGKHIIINISGDGLIEETHLIGLGAREELTQSIITKLNEIYETNGEYNNLETLELFVKNNNDGIARDRYSGRIYTDFIYINRERITESLSGENGFFIEIITVNRRNIGSIITVSCG